MLSRKLGGVETPNVSLRGLSVFRASGLRSRA